MPIFIGRGAAPTPERATFAVRYRGRANPRQNDPLDPRPACRHYRIRYYVPVQYEWDNGKAAENLRKHGVDFADAIAALEDPDRVEEIDERLV